MKSIAGKPRQPLADKILKRMQKEINRDIIDLSAVRAGRKHASDLQQTIATEGDLAILPAAHAAYTWVQNQLSIMAGQLLAFDMLHRHRDIMERSEELYVPEGPPVSPLTRSYHSCWAVHDVGVGLNRETLGTIAIAINRKFGAHSTFIELAGKITESRYSVYQIIGSADALITMKDLFSGREFSARNASGYDGKAGEVWYTRVLAPNLLEPDVHVVFNTPYIMYQTSAEGWQRYFERVTAGASTNKRENHFHQHMKYGPEPYYWPEYIFQSYVNHTEGCIRAKGLPDIPESLPHHEKYQRSRDW